MTEMQTIEITRYHDRIIKDVEHLVEKYRRAMDWDIPENNDAESDKLIIQAIRAALEKVAEELEQRSANVRKRTP